jgi:PAS domain-containing protein
VFTDAKEPGHPIIFANDSFLSLTGYDREEVLGHRFSFLMARGADPKGLTQVEAAFAGGLSRVGRNPAHRIANCGSGGFFDRNLLRGNVTPGYSGDERCWCPSPLIGYQIPRFP